MTRQVSETLFENGNEHWIESEPLEKYLKKRKDVKFKGTSTANWRGYIGTWEIVDNKLYLIRLRNSRGDELGTEYLFPGQTRVFAEWFSGDIDIPDGERFRYYNMRYSAFYERNILLRFSKGVFIEKKIVDNREKFEIYRIAVEKRMRESEEREEDE